MRRASVLVTLVALGWAGCATFQSMRQSDADKRFEAGVRALESGDYGKARTELTWVAEHYNNRTVGQRALLIAAALEMDPRNPTRRTDVGSDLAASFLRLPERDTWVDPVAQTLYLQSLELGAAEERAQRAEAQQQQHQRELPQLPGPTVNARIKAVEEDRDRLAKRVAALEAQLADRDRELERIRKTIKP